MIIILSLCCMSVKTWSSFPHRGKRYINIIYAFVVINVSIRVTISWYCGTYVWIWVVFTDELVDRTQDQHHTGHNFRPVDFVICCRSPFQTCVHRPCRADCSDSRGIYFEAGILMHRCCSHLVPPRDSCVKAKSDFCQILIHIINLVPDGMFVRNCLRRYTVILITRIAFERYPISRWHSITVARSSSSVLVLVRLLV